MASEMSFFLWPSGAVLNRAGAFSFFFPLVFLFSLFLQPQIATFLVIGWFLSALNGVKFIDNKTPYL